MSSMIAWLIALAISICVIILAAALGRNDVHMFAAGLVSVAFALTAIRENKQLLDKNTSPSTVGSATARNLGLVWAWGALAILVTYLFILEKRWPEWWQFFAGFALAAIASVVFSNMLDRDAKAGKVDAGILKVGRALIAVQLVGVVLALVSMFIDGKFPRAITYADWAGCNIFFFGALAIIAISLDALRTQKPTAD